MYKITFGPRIHYVLTFMLVFLALSTWTSGKIYAQEISITVNSKVNPNCPDSNDGSINISVNGGSAPYSYNWTSGNYAGSTNEDISNLRQGTYTVTVTDSSTPTAKTESIDISLQANDITKPNVSVNNISVVLNSTGTVSISTDEIDNGSTDNCEINSRSLNKTNFNCSNLGANSVVLTITDNSGNTANATATVTVVDNISPSINAPANIQADADSNDCNASNVTLGTPATADNCGAASVTNDAPADFPLGETTVTWTVTDDAGNTATATQKVIVADNTNPTITAPANIQADTDSNDCNASSVTLGAPATADNCGVASITNDAPADFPLGETTVTWTVTDDAGNTATTIQKVIVADNTHPIITAPANVQANTDSNDCNASSVTLGTPATADNCGVASVTNDAPADFPLGETTVTWTVTDDAGNTATTTQTVIISDTTKPMITVGTDIDATNNTGICEAGLSIAPATATDNCNVGSPVGSRSDGLGLDEPYPVGTTTITWNVADANGNIADSVNQLVTVEDNESPEIPNLEDITWGCSYTVEAPIAIDNCTGEVTATTTDALTYSNAGTYTINWTFTDNAGNSSSTTQNIIIDPVVVQTTKTDVLCNGLATGEVQATATGGVAPLTYDWGTLGPGTKKTDLPAGTYTVTVTDANGCESEPISVIINEPDTFIEITDVITTSGCLGENNGTATVSAQGGTGAYAYLWENGQTSQTATDLAPGTHTVTITDENGCSKDRAVTVSQPTELKITGFLTTETTSFGSATGSATVQVTGGSPNYTFEWGGGPNDINQTDQTARELPAGIYTVIVTDANGCKTSGEVEVVDTLAANIVPISLCNEGELIRTSTFSVENGTAIGGTAPYSYSWDFGENANPGTGSGADPIDVTYGNIGDKLIILTVTDSKGRTFEQRIIQYVGGCFADDCGSNDLGLENYFIGDSQENEITSSNCSSVDEKFIYINFPTNATRYSLQIELIYSVEDIETGEISNYKVTDCFFNKDDIPKIAQTFSIDYECGDLVKVEGIYLTFQNNKNRTCGTTQGNGNNPKCFSTNNEATVSSPLFGVAFPNELLCNGSNNGSINVRASGGTGNYTYELISAINGTVVLGPQTSNVFNELVGGAYKVNISDGENIFTTRDIEIEQPANPLTLNIDTQEDVVCFGGTGGSATVSANGGTPNSSGDPYIFVWDNGQTGSTVSNLAAGDYAVRVIDANGCEISTTLTIEQPEELLANAGPDQVLGCGFSSTQLNAEVNLDENDEPVPGAWTIVNGPAGGSFADATIPNTVFNGNQGTYTLRWSLDCGKSDDAKITFTNCSTLDFDGVDDHVNFGNNYGFTGGVFTVEAWIKPKSIDGTRTVLSKKDFANPAGGFELIMSNGVPNFKGLGVSSFTTHSIKTDRWYHLAVSFDGSTAKLYVDGILLGSKTASSTSSTSAPFLLGALYDSTAPYNPKNLFHGWMEEVRIWSKSLDVENIRLLMNQRIVSNSGKVRGEIIPIDATSLSWTDLLGYYRLLPAEISNGVTFDIATNKINGKLINIQTTQQNTAPLPYISSKNGSWREKSSWLRPTVWDVPNARGINNDTINWNIAINSHTLNSSYKDIKLLGLISNAGSASKLNMEGSVNQQTGNEIYLSHYLQLNGVIDLNGESQLVQPEGSILANSSTGYLDRDQQGTANSFNYNYWTSPVSLTGSGNNSGYVIKNILLDGTNPNTPKSLVFDYQFHWADGNYSGNKRISSYWLYTFKGNANDYSEWHQFGETELLEPGIGYSMKGTTGYVPVTNKQNYTFRGKPNNGDISVSIGGIDQNLLTGNPYPSAIDASMFIGENLGGFNGSLYFWDHFGPVNSHILEEYVGGYAVYNLSGGIASASSVDSRINPNGDISKKDPPGKYIPVGQAFFISSTGVSNPTQITYRNRYRAFVPESTDDSQFHSQEKTGKKDVSNKYTKDNRFKIRLKFESPKGYHRQILVTADENSSGGFDLGYDAPLIENNVEDMYWMIDETEFVIQAVPDFNLDQVLPIGIKISEEGEYTIKIDELENIKMEFNVYLKDKSNDTYFNLTKDDYKATAEELGYFNDRYEIVFKEPQTEEEEEEEEEEDIVDEKPEELDELPLIDLRYIRDTDEIAVLNPDLMNVDRVELFSISGQLIKTFQEVPTEESIMLSIDRKLSSAVYIVKMYSGEESYSRKVIISN
ncbi:LamG-like jellyroll fold domain-containing protein [Christiangramia forsetii]|uniref:Secreted hyalin domain protein-likely involved in carbohydrate binding or cell-adhesion n=2 Tax=Christiangramia forsetii TaxID=411153 RepID=A0LYD3_CHRFK|nr:LamG-like jellyroll fold domain-containing protein [Christiangramia forsetii]GGG34511.1 hypothetical protein GCM10011532_17710 [Christiangramia forsetii]CAL65378.1 secreted hyalin domain protein-likely involved in carbohydrate binding or cell-adhesion [Christiangramia forsetii KT0803]